MKKVSSILLITVVLISMVGCISPNARSENEPNDTATFYVPESFPYISFIIPDGYDIYYEKLELIDLYKGTWRATLHNLQEDTYISIAYDARYVIKDGSWYDSFKEMLIDGEYYDDYTLPQLISETEGYTIHHIVENSRLYVLPKNWDDAIGMVCIAYDHFYLADYGIENDRFVGRTIDTGNGDVEAALKLAESITPSTLTHEEYKRLMSN